MKILIFEGSLSPPSFICIMLKELVENKVKIFLAGSKVVGKPILISNSIELFDVGNSQRPLSLLKYAFLYTLRLLFKRPINLFISLRHAIGASKMSLLNGLKTFNVYNVIALVNPDIIHVQWASHLSLFKPLLNHKTRKRPKIVVSLRGRLVNVSPLVDTQIAKLYCMYFPKVDAFHAVSNAIAQESVCWGADIQKIKVIYSGLELEKLKKFRKLDWNLHNPIKIIMVGRFHWIKGYRYALDAFYLLLKEKIQVEVVIIAGGVSDEINYYLKEAKLGSYVHIIPHLPQETVFKYMQASDIFLLPSVEEGIANVVLEAMAIGLPVISSDCGGMREVIEHNVNGLLFENRNVNDLIIQLKDMMNKKPDERKNLAIAGYQTIEQRFGADRLGKEMIMLYRSVLELDGYRYDGN